MNNKNSYSVILPTLNEVGHIKPLIYDISNILTKYEIEYEIIIVDDNSSDGTVEEIEKIKKLPVVIKKRIGKKKSLVNSLNEGIQISNFNNIIWMDADYSHPPKYISEFINIKKNKDIDLIVCSRFLKDSVRYYNNENLKPVGIDILSFILNKICQKILFNDFTDYTSGYICIKKNLIKDNKLKGYYGDYFINLITNCKVKDYKILEIPFVEKDRASGQSKTTGSKINFLIKCYFYIYQLFKSLIIKNIN